MGMEQRLIEMGMSIMTGRLGRSSFHTTAFQGCITACFVKASEKLWNR